MVLEIITCISRIRLFPLNERTIIPIAFSLSQIFSMSDFTMSDWLLDTPMGLPFVIERTQINVQYPIAVMAPIRDTIATEFRLGSWAIRIAIDVNTKNHSVLVNELAWHVVSLSHMVWKKRCMVPPPLITRRTHVAPDKYITGNMASSLPSFGPAYIVTHYQPCMYKGTHL